MGDSLLGGGGSDRNAEAYALLLTCSVSQRQVIEPEAGAQCDKAVSKAKLDPLAPVNNLVQRAPRSAGLLSEGFALIDWQAKVVVFEAFHARRIPEGIAPVNTFRSYTCRYHAGSIG